MFQKGLNQDSNTQNQPEDTYRDALNLSLVREPGALSQEVGLETLYSLPEGSKVVGKAYFPDGEILLFVRGLLGSSIHMLSGETLTTVFQDNALSLLLGDYVQAVGTVNNKGERVVYWTDEKNPPRRLNLDTITSGFYTAGLDIGLYYSFGEAPQITPLVSAAGGVLKTGVYRVAVALVDDEGAVTPYLTVSQGVAVFPGAYLDARTTTGGENTVNTSRSISLAITGLPESGFRGVRIATIKNTEVRILGEYPLTGTYTITGAEAYTPGSLEEVIVAPVSYSTAKAIAEQSGSLYLGNLSRGDDLGYQRYANRISLHAVTEEFTAAKVLEQRSNGTVIMGPADNDHRRAEKFSFKKTFKRGETYAFYISLILKDGSETPGYHIPGRVAEGNENTASFADPQDAAAIGFTKRFHQESKIGSNGMGYWENQGEVYPEGEDFQIWNVGNDGIGFPTGNTLVGLPVRHHQFPDAQLSPVLKTGATPGKVIGVELRNIKFPKEIKDLIIGYRVYYAERGFENQRVLDQSILARTWKNNDFGGGDTIYAGPRNAQDQNAGLSNDYKVAYPFHLMRTKKATSAIQYLKHVTSLHSGGDSGPYRPNIDPSVATAPPGVYTKKVEFAGYVDHNTDDVAVGVIDPKVFVNLLAPSVLVMEVPHWDRPYTNEVVDFCRFLPQQYFPFYGQRLVWTGFQSMDLDNPVSGPIYGGDTFITYHAYRAVQPDDQGPNGEVYLHQQVVESLDLIALRHEGDLVYETYFPKSEWFPGFDSEDATLYNLNPEEEDYNIRGPVAGENYNLYNEEFSSSNNLRTAFAWNPFTTNDTVFPVRVARSKKGSLRTFLSEDYRDLTTKRGPVVKLVPFGSELLIHHRGSLFRTRGSTELQTDQTRTFIGSGDILSVDPEELYTTDEGYGGLQNPHESAITPVGYVFTDTEARKIFQLSSGLKEISGPGSGLRDFFKENIMGTVIPGYDPRYNRVFFSCDENWTLTYLPVEGVWESFHTGTPQSYFWNKLTLYSVLEAEVYQRGGVEGIYYGVMDNIELEISHNKDPFIDKSISSLLLDTLVRDSTEIEIQNETFGLFQVLNEYQNTGVLPVVYFTEPLGNARRTKRIWNVNGLRHEGQPETYGGTLPAWSRRRISGKVHRVRLTFTPEEGKRITVFAVDLTYRTSIR